MDYSTPFPPVTMIHQPHDKFFKKSMGNRQVARDFFVAHLPPALLATLDLDSLHYQNNSFIDTIYQATAADIIYAVKIQKRLAYLYLLCENQSQVDQRMAFRLLTYQVGLMESHAAQYPQDPYLPIIYPMVVYTGTPPWTAPLDFFELYGEQAPLARQIFLQPYQLIDVHRLSDQDLRNRALSGLVEFALKHRKVKNLSHLLEILFPWIDEIESQVSIDFAKTVLNYLFIDMEAEGLQLLMEKAAQHLSEILQEEIMTLAQQCRLEGQQEGRIKGQQEGRIKGQQEGRIKGQQEGRREGRLEGKIEIAQRLLAKHMPVEMISEITGLSNQHIQALQNEK